MEVSIRISPNSDDEDTNNNGNPQMNNVSASGHSTNTENNNMNLTSATSIFNELLNQNNTDTGGAGNNNNNLQNLFQNSITSRLTRGLNTLYNSQNNSQNNNEPRDIISNNPFLFSSDNNNAGNNELELPPNLNLSNNTTTTTNANNADNISHGQNPGNNTTTTTTTTTTTNTSTARINIPMLFKWVEQNITYMLILFIVFIYLHRQTILVFLWHQAVFVQANYAIKTQVALQDKRRLEILGLLVLILVSNIYTNYLFYNQYDLWRSLLLMTPKVELTIWNVFWVTLITDFMVRFISMIFKAIAIMLVGHRPPYRRRAQLYSAIEVANQLYRTLIPIPVWSTFLHTIGESENVFGSLMVGIYLTYKLSNLIEKGKHCFERVKAYLVTEVVIGELCAICQEKMVSPILLRCNHLFCEDCISQWFEHKKTCPLCRTPINLSVARTHSDGSTSLLFQLF